MLYTLPISIINYGSDGATGTPFDATAAVIPNDTTTLTVRTMFEMILFNNKNFDLV